VLQSTDGGRTWRALALSGAPTAAPSAISCPSASWCVALDDGARPGTVPARALVTTDAGRTWSEVPTTLGGPAWSLSCTAAGTCLMAGPAPTAGNVPVTDVVASTDRGASWRTVATLVSGPATLTCTGGARCWLTGASGTIFSSTDGGRHWRKGSLFRAPGNLSSASTGLPLVACPAGGGCWVTGTTGGGTTVVFSGPVPAGTAPPAPPIAW
jgi:photosystem II stability/assembly factor-like uncharacterized protein